MSEENMSESVDYMKIEEILNTKAAGAVIISALKQWKLIESASVVMLALQLGLMFHLSHSCLYTKILFIAGFVLFIVLQVFIMRLYFDKLLFEQIYDYKNIAEDIKLFDKVMNFLVCSKLKPRTMESRWKGTKCLIKTAFGLLSMQIVIVLLEFLIYLK